MKIRLFQPSDVDAINNIWERYHRNDYSVPDRRNSIIDAVVEAKGELIAYGQVKRFAESIFVIDKGASQRSKVEALKLLMSEALRGSNLAGLEDIYCFIKDPSFATLISKHFGFEIVDNPGELLLRKV